LSIERKLGSPNRASELQNVRPESVLATSARQLLGAAPRMFPVLLATSFGVECRRCFPRQLVFQNCQEGWIGIFGMLRTIHPDDPSFGTDWRVIWMALYGWLYTARERAKSKSLRGQRGPTPPIIDIDPSKSSSRSQTPLRSRH